MPFREPRKHESPLALQPSKVHRPYKASSSSCKIQPRRLKPRTRSPRTSNLIPCRRSSSSAFQTRQWCQARCMMHRLTYYLHLSICRRMYLHREIERERERDDKTTTPILQMVHRRHVRPREHLTGTLFCEAQCALGGGSAGPTTAEYGALNNYLYYFFGGFLIMIAS